MKICVYCGSSPGQRPEYLLAAQQLGNLIAHSGWDLVYGGASIGLMGAVADAALSAGGKVVGIIPHNLAQKEITHAGLSEVHYTQNMHERKAKMAQLADAFIALPGGLGTFDELCEILTWGLLKLHDKPCILLNILNYFEPFQNMLIHARQEGFLSPSPLFFMEKTVHEACARLQKIKS